MKPDENNPTEWFEPLYNNASIDGTGVPWAHMNTHPSLGDWLKSNPINGNGKKALVVGCGMGDDAITLSELGFSVTAFDVSHSAIEHCKKRFPNSDVNFQVVDLFKAPKEWNNFFDFVLEIYTVQALPPKYEEEVIQIISQWPKKEGLLLAVASVSQQKRSFENGPPWLLNPNHVDLFCKNGLEIIETKISPKADFDSELYVTTFKK